MSTALVRLSSPPVAPPTTVFAEFYAKVVHMLDAGTATSTSGAVVWTAQIVNTMLRDGAWPLVLAASTVIGKQPVTNDDVMNVLGRLDRVLSVGIPLHYGSVDAAVRAFVDVLAVIDRALAFGLRPGMTLSPDAWRTLRSGNDAMARTEIRKQTGKPVAHAASLWQTPVYQFLAECVKAARVHADKIEDAQRDFAEVSRLCSPSGRSYDMDVKGVMHVDASYGRLDSDRAIVFDSLPFLTALERIAAAKEEALFIQRYPIHFGELESVVSLSVELPSRFMDTQVFLAALGVSDRQYLKMDELEAAFVAVKRLTNVELVERTVAKLIADGMELDVPATKRLMRKLRGEISWMHQQKYTVGMHVADQFLVAGDMFALGLSHEEALRKAMSLYSRDEMMVMSSEARRDFALQLGNAIVWSRVKTADVTQMLRVGAVRLGDIVAHAHETQNPTEVGKRLIARGTLSESQIVSLLERGVVEGSREFVLKNWNELSNEFVLAFALRMAKSFADRKDGHKDIDATFIVKVMARVDERVAAAVLQPVANRFTLTMTLGAYIVFPDEFSGTLNAVERTQFRRRVSLQTLQSFAMAMLVWTRSDTYAHWQNPIESGELAPPWERLTEPVFGETNHAYLLQVVSESLGVEPTALLAEQSEEAWMRWLCEGHPKANKIVARFLADRDRYFAKLKSLGIL